MFPLLRISEIFGRIALKFGMCLETHQPNSSFLTKVKGGAQLQVRTCTPLFWYLGNGWTDCAEICYVVRDPLARRFERCGVNYEDY